MRKRTVRLTESELTRLIKRIVEDTEMGAMEMERPMARRKGFSIMDAVQKAAEIFERDFADNLDEETMSELESKTSRINVDRAISKLERNKEEELSGREEMASEKIDDMLGDISESFLSEGKFDRIKSIIARANIFGGLGIIGAAGTAFVSMLPGYVDFEFLLRVHEMVETTGCTRYCGPLSFFIACLGVAMFFHGMSRKDYLDAEMSRNKGGDEEMGESYFY
jgi:hypothetical protein